MDVPTLKEISPNERVGTSAMEDAEVTSSEAKEVASCEVIFKCI